jgi:membrane protease YdiL (CAAX protease family)
MSAEKPGERSWWAFASFVAGIAIAFVPVAGGYVKRYSIPVSSAAGIYGCFVLLLIYAIAPAMSAGRALLGRVIGRRYGAVNALALLVLPYLVYAVGTSDFRWLALGRVMAIAAPMIIIYSAFQVDDQSRFNWQDVSAALWLIYVVLFHLFSGIWSVPVNLDFIGRLFMLSLGAMCWTYIRSVRNLGYRLELNTAVLSAAAINFVFFAAIAIPLGLILGFTSWNARWSGVADFLIVYLEIFLFIALLEELFFRGFLQNLLGRSLHSWWRGQLIASCIFGLFHILHAPFPNWRYVVLATIAGWFYGSAYRVSGTLLSSALLHAMVDTVWRTFFTKT